MTTNNDFINIHGANSSVIMINEDYFDIMA